MGALDDILDGVRSDLARQADVSLDRLKQRVQHVDPALDPMPVLNGPGVSVIAEVKRSSPSKGPLAKIADPALAAEYEAGGAATVSVLTEGRRSPALLDDLVAVRCAVGIPVLRRISSSAPTSSSRPEQPALT